MERLDKTKLLEWLKQKRMEDMRLSIALKDEHMKAKHDHYQYVASVIAHEINRGTFDTN